MGLFAALAEEFLVTLLLLRDIFDAIAPRQSHCVNLMLKHILKEHKIY